MSKRKIYVLVGPSDNPRQLVLNESDLSPETIAGLVGDARRLLERLDRAAASARQILGGER